MRRNLCDRHASLTQFLCDQLNSLRLHPQAIRSDPIEQVIIPTPADGLWTVTINGTSIPQGPQNFAVCVNVSRLPVALTASIQASPVSGDAPLTVSFSSLGSTGTISSIKWDFGDGSTDTGATVSHTYTAIGQFTAIVTLISSNALRMLSE